MSLTSGFFNSVNNDRLYDAEQMSQIFDGIINDGIYDSIGTAFAVAPASGMTVNVGIGRAWLNHVWVYNDTVYPLTLTAASASLNRIDTVAIKIDHSLNVRSASIVVVEGTPAASAVAPVLPPDDVTNGVYYHRIADISVAAGTTDITAAMITSHIGLSTGTPYVTGIIASTTFDQLWAQLQGEFYDWWDNTIKPIIDESVVTRLQNNIDHVTPKEATMNLYGFSHQNPPPEGKTYAEYSTDAILNKLDSLIENDGLAPLDVYYDQTYYGTSSSRELYRMTANFGPFQEWTSYTTLPPAKIYVCICDPEIYGAGENAYINMIETIDISSIIPARPYGSGQDIKNALLNAVPIDKIKNKIVFIVDDSFSSYHSAVPSFDPSPRRFYLMEPYNSTQVVYPQYSPHYSDVVVKVDSSFSYDYFSTITAFRSLNNSKYYGINITPQYSNVDASSLTKEIMYYALHNTTSTYKKIIRCPIIKIVNNENEHIRFANPLSDLNCIPLAVLFAVPRTDIYVVFINNKSELIFNGDSYINSGVRNIIQYSGIRIPLQSTNPHTVPTNLTYNINTGFFETTSNYTSDRSVLITLIY